MEQESKLSLPNFLKILASNGVPVPKAMAIAGKIYKENNTPSKLSELTDTKLGIAGITDKEDRKAILSAFRKAGYVYKGKPITKETGETTVESSSAEISQTSEQVGPSKVFLRPKRKRGLSKDRNEYLLGEADESERDNGNFEFNEILDEDVLHKKSCVINRAPVMMAWAMVVAERLGFNRPEALSIGKSPLSWF
ncbi:hypothetical protein AGABI1DRAFT_127790 [Agaricus bisporus var. burnettii JB137-S8]|uniref:Uncharacterized protein n=1 Tax=Agaricus bisporus var. burnettii (strain JB137-S8 / ATCC MYA-4627 / FGSC 10392) TaxID=597362 RepID=K5XAQ2_AGABU|nr:uncharacterized protein AGABI1DRAFT_127790 [Agaricus bisporus var. burnettii JB137-S8]EKM80112.1 hypothetical protein AGABI1DRAFT_127790 [Agaricus bisporus var. burnettii JB137-S8]